MTDTLPAPNSETEPATLPTLSVDAIIAGLEAERDDLVASIQTDVEKIARLQSLNSQRRARLRQVKRMLTAAKPPRPKKAGAVKKAAKS